MHVCLQVLDILRSIFTAAYQESKDGPKSVAFLAATCKTFQDPALDILWRTLPSLLPLIKCLPSDAWVMIVKGSRKNVTLQRATTESDWIRCSIYAPRVRRLGFLPHPRDDGWDHPIGDLDVDSSILEVLSVSRILSFTNLQALRWTASPYINLFLRPTLLHLDASLPEEDKHFLGPTLINSLRTTCPSLRTLHLSASRHPDLPSDVFRNVVSGLNHLEVLGCDSFVLPDDALRMLAVSSTLRVLHTSNNSQDFLRCMHQDGTSFPVLQHWSFRTRDLPECSEVFKNLKLVPQHLHSLAVIHSDESSPPAAEVYDFFQVLERCCSHSILSSIHLSQDGGLSADDEIWQSDDYLITLAILKPLFSFKNLEGLDVVIECPFDFDNTSMETIALAWPRMRQFHLGTDLGWGKESRLTLDGLIPFAKCWPALESLTIALRAITAVSAVRRPGGGSCCPQLQTMVVTVSPVVSEPQVVAAFLTDLFPNLDTIIPAEFFNEWEAVQDLLVTFSNVRKQERSWKASGIMVSFSDA